jgi:hypothetical protein
MAGASELAPCRRPGELASRSRRDSVSAGQLRWLGEP